MGRLTFMSTIASASEVGSPTRRNHAEVRPRHSPPVGSHPIDTGTGARGESNRGKIALRHLTVDDCYRSLLDLLTDAFSFNEPRIRAPQPIR